MLRKLFVLSLLLSSNINCADFAQAPGAAGDYAVVLPDGRLASVGTLQEAMDLSQGILRGRITSANVDNVIKSHNNAVEFRNGISEVTGCFALLLGVCCMLKQCLRG